ncbi:type IV secretory system conjugative DNA transfer family protein [Streptococcus iniae]|uniref:VirD4-like conjugal transfer protein, CD1115 family n=1 Tax=Streptococcus iniae TaxID=1346 RepID=UPI0003660CE8|nr:type IV secretory system conjugative DNA transfer family protein [Streptococcus iniae]ESR10526.1 conjugal transfer protein TraD [Streptococcus iniae IUSA1]KYJ81235.1 conjugal transfer protein TraD [Streptococcus iniae]RMI72499.1 type IV secretory system conjugative DNA transfer family protein [Streptococcus iniae]HEK4517262.1 type IV secretory system conjugative DNA transfer family protein [Streptococcus iniae]
MTQKKSFKPYLIAGFICFYIGHFLMKLYQVSPDTRGFTDPLGIGRISWMSEHPLANGLIDIIPSIPSLITGMLFFFIPIFFYLKVSPQENYRSGEEHGSAKFATIEEMKKFRDPDPNNDMIFSQHGRMGLFNKRLSFAVQLNKNTATIGTPGDWKTRSLVKPNVIQLNSSFALTDPKGLTVYETGYLLKENGYEIKVFDLVHLANSNQFNVFKYMTDETDIDRVTESIIAGTTKSTNQGEDFWVQAETLLIRALIGFLYFDGEVLKNYEPSIAMVADMLRCLKREDPEIMSPIELMFKDLEKELPDNYAGKQFDLFMANFGGNTLMSVLAVTSARFAVFDHDAVRSLVATDNMNIEKWQEEKTAVFIAIPETDKSYNFLANLMFVTMFRVLPKVADEILQGKHQRLKPKDLLHFRYILDEFAQLGRIPNFVESQSSIRSREQSIDIIIQAINQIKTVYKDDWRTILNNCGALIYLGTNDEDTMRYFSTRAGKQTIQVRTKSQTYSKQGSSTENVQTIARDLMTPDEIARIDIQEALVFVAKQNVFRDKKFDLLSHPNAEYLADDPDDKYWYTYHYFMSDVDEWEANVSKEVIVEATGQEVDNPKLPWNQSQEKGLETIETESEIAELLEEDFVSEEIEKLPWELQEQLLEMERG